MREDARVGAAVTGSFHERFDEALVGGVAVGVVGDSQNALDHPGGFFLEAALADAVEQVEYRLDAFGAGELLDAFFHVDAVGEESGEGADCGFADADIVFLLQQFDQWSDGVGRDEAE